MVRRRRRSRTISPQMIIVAVIVILICSSSLFVVMSSGKETVSSNDLDIRSLITRFFAYREECAGFGYAGWDKCRKLHLSWLPAAVPGEFLRNAVLFFANVDIHDMRSWFQIEIPLSLAIVKNGYPAVSAAAVPNFPKFDYTNNVLNAQPLVGIYHTHTAESFLPSAGVTHRQADSAVKLLRSARRLRSGLKAAVSEQCKVKRSMTIPVLWKPIVHQKRRRRRCLAKILPCKWFLIFTAMRTSGRILLLR